MRAAWLLALLLLLAPFGLAQGDGSSSSSTSNAPPACEPDADEDDCDDQRRCRQDPERCRHGNETSDDDGDDEAADEDGDDGRHGSCRSDDDGRDRDCERNVRQLQSERGFRWISFQVDARNATLLNYTIAGVPAIDQVRLGLDGGNLSVSRNGSTVRVTDGSSELRLHDEPNGLIRFKGENGSVTLHFPAGSVAETSEQGARLAYQNGRTGHLLAENATWTDGATVDLDGFFAFHVPPRQADHETDSDDDAEDDDDKPREARIADERRQQAIERRTVGAEITIKPAGDAQALGTQPASGPVEVLAYDDVEVAVDVPADLAVPDSPLRVIVSSHLNEGRTIVLHVDEAFLASDDPADLLLRYFDLYNQTDGSTLETEVLFKQAASLDDVLDPADDGGQPEYWVVRDANGMQVLVSVPHWSAHAITVASISSALPPPSVALGIVAGAAVALVMGVALLWPRRRDDEL